MKVLAQRQSKLGSAVIIRSTCVAFLMFLITAASGAEPARIILDTDFGDDGDDLAVVAVLNHMADLGEAEILAIGQSNSRWDAPGAIDVINTYYGRPDIPIGIVSHKTHEGDQYSSFLVENYEFDLDLEKVPSAVEVYRRALASAPDKSVKFVVVGFKSNMRDLLMSKPDEISPLSGVELVRQKVILVSDMGGRYPSQTAKDSFNFKTVKGAAKYYVENWPTPMIFSGVGTGSIKVGHRVRKLDTPVGRAMDLKLAKGWKPGEKFQAGFDLASLLVAVRGADRYFNVKSGCNRVEANGANTFNYERDCAHQHIDSQNRKISYEKIGEILEEMLLTEPKHAVDKKSDALGAATNPVPVIFDTDMAGDWDDCGATAVLHALADRGEAEILGMGVNIAGESAKWSPQVLDAINTYYKRPDIPIGIARKGVSMDDEYGKWAIDQGFPTDIGNDGAADVVDLYRKLLANASDKSVVLISVGYFASVNELLESKPDKHSTLSGRELVRKKIKLWSCMGGTYPEGSEANLQDWRGLAKNAIENWPTPIIFSGNEIGCKYATGESLKRTAKTNPVRRIYEYMSNKRGSGMNHCSFDQTAVFAGVREPKLYWDLTPNGTNTIYLNKERKTFSRWKPMPDSGHRYLLPKDNIPEVTKVISDLMCAPPGVMK